MKNASFTFGFFFCIIFSSFSQNSWHLFPSPVSENLVSVCFPNTANGFIISENATIIKTTDSGNSWETLYAWPGIHLNAICFSDEMHGCSVGWFNNGNVDSSLILITVDGGNLWTWIDHPAVNRFNDVFFIDNDKGWAVGSKGEQNLNCIYYTSDGGLTWSEQTGIMIVGAELKGVSFRNENQGSVCGADGAFFLTSSGGSSWAMGISMPVLNLNDIFNFGILSGCIVGDDGTALYTTNNWYQYVETTTNINENLNAVSGDATTNKLWAVGDNGTIIYTPNYLFGWVSQESGTIEDLNDICMLSEDEGWAVGNNGTILYYGPTSDVNNTFSNKEFNVFPNPTSGLINIEGEFQQKETVIQIVDMTGKSKLRLQGAYDYQLNVDLSGNPTGIYYLVVSSATCTWTEKIFLH